MVFKVRFVVNVNARNHEFITGLIKENTVENLL